MSDKTVSPARVPGSLADVRERIIGNSYAAQREAGFKALVSQCPPVDPHLVRHLEAIFSDIVDTQPTHPQLSNMLLVQHGINKILKYLNTRHEQQSQAARQRRTI